MVMVLQLQQTKPIDFLIIGAMKCGTSQLYSHLYYNPQINLSKLKEPNFFNEKAFHGKWSLGFQWYATLFQDRPGLRGEASTAYTKRHRDQEAAEHILETNPDVKLIYIVRHPVDRAISHYLHNALSNRERRDIHSALLDKNTHYVETGLYYQQLQPYFDRFPRKHLFVLEAESFWKSPAEHLDDLYDFLQVPKVPYDPAKHTRKNALLQHARGFMSRELALFERGEAQYHLTRALSSTWTKSELTSTELSRRLGFGDTDRAALGAFFQEDTSEFRKIFRSVGKEWRL